MAKAFNIQVKGLKELQAKFNSLPKRVREEVSGQLELGAQNIVKDAKKNLRSQVNTGSGTAMRLITYTGKDLSYSVTAAANYSPYLEFGTGKGVRIPSGLDNYASQFKGRGVRKNNMKARPYLFPAFFNQKVLVFRNIQKVLKSLD